ncbi:MAG: M48 family metalloprotease [Rhizobiaceae bacterium]
MFKFKSSNRWLAALACFGLSACQILASADQIAATVSPDDQPKTGFSLDKLRAKDPQSKIGARGHPKVLAANGGAYQSQKLDEMLAVIVGRLITHSNDPDRVFEITVLDSPTVNAFALPGGYLYVTRGLLTLANDASEVAAVLAHEMAHVSSNHGILRNRQAKAVTLADRVTNEVVTNPVVAKVAKASTERRLAAFSQNQELQADAVGIKMLGESGYDPFAAARFLVAMDRYSNWSTALNIGADDMSSTHPSTPRRIELARRHARQIGPVGTGKRYRERYLEGIDGLIFGDRGGDGVIRDNRFAHARLGVTFTVPGTFELVNRDDSVLASGPGEMAVRFDAEDKGFGLGRPASYLRSGWVNGLVDSSIKSQTINGLPAATARAVAGDWQFVVTVIDFDRRYYRFILAAPKGAENIEPISKAIAGSFKKMTVADKAALKLLRMKIVKVQRGDTVAKLASRMKGVPRKEALFRSINGLKKGQQPRVGSDVKLIVD